MQHDYRKWAIGCLVREVGRALPQSLRRSGDFYEVTSRATDITDVVEYHHGRYSGRYRAQWLLRYFMETMRTHAGPACSGPIYEELERRLKEDQEKRGVFDTSL